MLIKKNSEPTINDVLSTINDVLNEINNFKNDVKKDIGDVKREVSDVKREVNDIKNTIDEVLTVICVFSQEMENRLGKVDQKFDRVEAEIVTIKATMVTKEYLDDKLADMRGNLVELSRKEDSKVGALTEALFEKKVLDKKGKDYILKMGPFPRIA